MSWARLDPDYFTHAKVAQLSKDAKLLDLAAIAFSARELRDGVLSHADVRVIAAQVDAAEPFVTAQELVSAGRWTANSTGFGIHDYLKYNPSRAKVLQERADAAARMASWRASKQDQKPRRRRKQRSNGVTHGVTAGEVHLFSDSEPGLDTRTPVSNPVSNSEPGDARATREGSEFQIDDPDDQAKRAARASIAAVTSDAVVGFNQDLATRLTAISQELNDDNAVASITRAQRFQAAAHLDDGTMANAIKDAHRRARKRISDLTRAPPGSRMAYFLAILEQTTQERATAT